MEPWDERNVYLRDVLMDVYIGGGQIELVNAEYVEECRQSGLSSIKTAATIRRQQHAAQPRTPGDGVSAS